MKVHYRLLAHIERVETDEAGEETCYSDDDMAVLGNFEYPGDAKIVLAGLDTMRLCGGYNHE